MANPCLLHLPLRDGLDGRDRNGIVTATASGPVRFTADGYFAEEATTNYHANPVLNSNDTDWLVFASVGSTVSGARVTDQPDMGASAAWRMTVDVIGAASHGLTIYTRTPAGVVLTGSVTPSAVVKANRAVPAILRTRLVYDDASQEDTLGDLISLSTTVETLTFPTATVNAAKTLDRVYLMIFTEGTYGAQVGDVIWMTKAQIENKAYATSYCDGSLGTGYSWAGTAHASASSRAEARLSLDEAGRIFAPSGAIALRFKRLIDSGNHMYLMAVGQSSAVAGTDFVGVRIDSNDKLQLLTLKDGVNQSSAITANAVAVDAASIAYADWNSTTIRAILNGQSVATGVRVAPNNNLDTTNELAFGQLYSGTFRFDGYLSDILIFDRPLTDAERVNLVAMDEWSFDVLQPKFGGVLRIGTGVGLAISSVAAPAAVAIARTLGGL